MSETKYEILNKYLNLPQPNCKCLITYIWIHEDSQILKSKTMVYNNEPKNIEEIQWWGMVDERYVDCKLKPVALFNDPFHCGNNKLVLCETLDFETNEPTFWNKRQNCLKVINQISQEYEPWFGIEQEYFLLDKDNHPLGWPKIPNSLDPNKPYWCAVGTDKAFGRYISDAHCRACLYAGIKISGTNGECMPSQWEYQIGPCEGIDASDQLWVSRYILERIAEEFEVIISFDPKPAGKHWYGSSAHFNFSTKQMRQQDGLKHIEKAVLKLSKFHKEHLEVYDPHGGEDNRRRLTGLHETSSMNEFSYGVAGRFYSVNIPRSVFEKKSGFLEDRRPASNCDPYIVSEILIRTILVNNKTDDLLD